MRSDPALEWLSLTHLTLTPALLQRWGFCASCKLCHLLSVFLSQMAKLSSKWVWLMCPYLGTTGSCEVRNCTYILGLLWREGAPMGAGTKGGAQSHCWDMEKAWVEGEETVCPVRRPRSPGLLKTTPGTSLVVQCLGICLAMRGTWVPYLVRKLGSHRCVCVCVCVWERESLSGPTLCNPVDCSLPGSSVHGILQARVPEWFAISFSRGSFWPRDWTPVSCIAGGVFTIWATRDSRMPWDK